MTARCSSRPAILVSNGTPAPTSFRMAARSPFYAVIRQSGTPTYSSGSPGSELPRHWHTSAERMVLVSGELHLTFDSQKTEIARSGTYIYAPPELPHEGRCGTGDPCILFIAFEEPIDATASGSISHEISTLALSHTSHLVAQAFRPAPWCAGGPKSLRDGRNAVESRGGRRGSQGTTTTTQRRNSMPLCTDVHRKVDGLTLEAVAGIRRTSKYRTSTA